MAVEHSIVSAADSSFFWGLLLLGASLRRGGSNAHIYFVLEEGCTDHELQLLSKFANIEEIRAGRLRFGVDQKPYALRHADGEFRHWIDADSLIVGNIDTLLKKTKRGIHLRFRGDEENRSVFRGHLASDEAGIPNSVLNKWRQDVGERDRCRFQTQCVANAISVDESSLSFIDRWDAQMRRVLRQSTTSVIERRNDAYVMTDESVLASLLLFADEIPSIHPYHFDQYDRPRLIHFSGAVKPWQRWRAKHIQHIDETLATVEWLRTNFDTKIDIPRTLRERSRNRHLAEAKIDEACGQILRPAKMLFRKATRHRRKQETKPLP